MTQFTKKPEKRWQSLTRLLLVGVSALGLAVISGCSSGTGMIMPRTEAHSESPWKTFDDVKAAYEDITPGETTQTDLVSIGFDPDTLQNVKILHYLEVLREFREVFTPEGMPDGLKACLAAQSSCRGYDMRFEQIEHRRAGNLPADLMGFRKKTRTTGWEFHTKVIMVDDVVVYKLWNGTPEIETYRTEAKPLGPLQGFTSLVNPF